MLKKIYRFLSPRFQTVFLDYPVDQRPRYGHGKPAHSGLSDIVNENREDYEQFIDHALTLKERIWEIQTYELEPNEKFPAWNNGFLPGLDIVSIYTMLEKHRPKKYLEIGSGNSTKVAFKVKLDHKFDFEIISIDPMPRAEVDSISDRVIREPFENINFDIANELEAGDILFVDNSHRMLPNSDATVFFMEILPRLKKGVIVHIHDIYIPFDYPQFMCDRSYSEQYGLASYLLANPKKFKTIFPCYFVSEDQELSTRLSPIWKHDNLETVEKHGGSYWIQIAE